MECNPFSMTHQLELSSFCMNPLIYILIVSIQTNQFWPKLPSLIFIPIVILPYKETVWTLIKNVHHTKESPSPFSGMNVRPNYINLIFLIVARACFKINKANSEGHVLSKIKTFLSLALEGFIFDKTFLLVVYLLRN